MTQHLIRTAAGIRDLDHLRQAHARYTLPYEGKNHPFVTTRNTPQRTQEILASGGSLYWIVKRFISARQKIEAFLEDRDEEGRRFCLIILSPEIILTENIPKKPIQGWRYLKQEDAPPDLRAKATSDDDLPQSMQQELRRLGLL